MTVDILFLAWNRLAFTKASFGALARNTPWASSVDRLIVYDDGSEDGTAEWLREAGAKLPVPAFDFREVSFRSPPATMNDYLATAEADLFAKVDSDIAMPPSWLDSLLSVMESSPELELLGCEAARNGTQMAYPDEELTWVSTTHIGGVGLMRVDSFLRRPPIMGRGRFGFTEFQHRHDPVRGWVLPDLPVLQLDRLPFEPWLSLAEEYARKGWQRRWPKYDDLRPYWWEWFAPQAVAA
jgi:glycosyltransferase involved in cell wall biosynthesis